MDKLMTPEFSRVLMLLGIGIISFSAIIAIVSKKIRSGFKLLNKKNIFYLLGFVVLFSVTALLITLEMFNSYTGYFIFFQMLFLIYGSVHIYLMKKVMDWSRSNKPFWADLLYTLLITAAGALCFLLVYRRMNREGLELPVMASVLFFIIPLFVYYTFLQAMEIPPKIFRQWYYPVHQPIEDPDESTLKNMLLISFEFQKNADDAYFTNFRAKAPADMEFGQLFYYFINDYNDRHPLGHIHFNSANGEPYGWMFYKKPKWYTIFTKYMDADKTIFINGVKENDIIVCVRIYEQNFNYAITK